MRKLEGRNFVCVEYEAKYIEGTLMMTNASKMSPILTKIFGFLILLDNVLSQ